MTIGCLPAVDPDDVDAVVVVDDELVAFFSAITIVKSSWKSPLASASCANEGEVASSAASITQHLDVRR